MCLVGVDAVRHWHFTTPLWPCCVWEVKQRTHWPHQQRMKKKIGRTKMRGEKNVSEYKKHKEQEKALKQWICSGTCGKRSDKKTGGERGSWPRHDNLVFGCNPCVSVNFYLSHSLCDIKIFLSTAVSCTHFSVFFFLREKKKSYELLSFIAHSFSIWCSFFVLPLLVLAVLHLDRPGQLYLGREQLSCQVRVHQGQTSLIFLASLEMCSLHHLKSLWVIIVFALDRSSEHKGHFHKAI